ncbi:hypothetical protein MPTK2_8g03270 [Marchantia polymorpha subsp. ruderalis]
MYIRLLVSPLDSSSRVSSLPANLCTLQKGVCRLEGERRRSMEKLMGTRLLLAILIMQVTVLELAGAVDMLFWSRGRCTGIVNPLCDSIRAGKCCNSHKARQSVQVKAMRGCYSTTTFKSGGCNETVTTMSGNVCFNSAGPTYTGAVWFNNCLHRALLTDKRKKSRADCSNHSKPATHINVVHYRDDPTKGIWTLRRANATGAELYEQLESVPDAEKVAWLKSQGATYDFETEGELSTFVDTY